MCHTNHIQKLSYVLRYLKGAPGQGLFFSSQNDLSLQAFYYSDRVGCPMTQRSTMGYCVFFFIFTCFLEIKKTENSITLLSRSRIQSHDRYMLQVIQLRSLLKDLQILHPKPALLHYDNKTALHIVANPVFHERTKHIEMNCHFIRDKIQDGSVMIKFVTSTNQLADVFTKPLGKEIFSTMIRKLGVLDIHSPT